MTKELEPLRIATGRWANQEKEGKPGKYAKMPVFKPEFSYSEFSYGIDHPEQFTPWWLATAPGGMQLSIICAPSTRLLAIDVDTAAEFPSSATGKLVSARNAISSRADHFHVLVDMRNIPTAQWPKQGGTPWGDIKSNGIIPVPGSLHYTGEAYAPAPDWRNRVIVADDKLVTALKQDRIEFANRKLAAARRDNPRFASVKDADGRHIFASGYVAGTWAQLPDGFLTSDDELKDLVFDMGTRGAGYEAVRDEWRRIAGATDGAWTDKDFDRHWRRVPAIYEQQMAEADAEEEGWAAFGIDAGEVGARAQAVRDRIIAEQESFVPYSDEPKPDLLAAGESLSAGKFENPPSSENNPSPVQSASLRDYRVAWMGAFPYDPMALTDDEHAELLLQRLYPLVRYCPMQDVWVGRNIDKWEVYPYDLADSLVGLPKAFGLMPQGASKERIREMDLDPEGDEARKLAAQMQNRLRYGNSSDAGKIGRSLRNTVRSLGAHPLAEDLLGMDTDPEEFWAGGTCWDLRKCAESLVPAEKVSNSVHLHSAACAPDDRVATPLWDALLGAVWPEADIRDWAQLVLSAGLTGYPKKIVPLLQGGKDRGKSTIIDAIADVLGTYFTPLNPRVLDANGSTHDTVLMDLKGARMVFLDEGLKRGSVSTSRLKRLAGGSSITANRMRKDPISFRPTHTLVIALNPEEALSFDDPAVETRIRLLPCEGDPAAVIEVAKQLEYFRSPAWLAERPGVLAKLMKYAGRMLEDPQSLSKDRAPMQAQMAEELIREDEDDVLRWFLEATTPHEAGFPSRDLFISFREWTRETKGDRYYIKSEKSWALRMDELVPEDGLHKLYTRNKSRLRRVRPLQPGEGQRPKAPVDVQGAAASFMSPGGNQGSPATTADSKPENPPAEPHAPADPPAFQIPGGVVDPGSVKVGKVGAGGSNLLTPYTHTHTHAKSESGNDPRTPRTPHPPAASQTGYELAADATGPRIVPRPSAQGGQDPESPLGAKNPNPEIPPQAEKPQKAPSKRQKLTDEERAAKKLQMAQDRAAAREEARLAKVAEVGGPIVPLPAIVLRDGLTVIPCTVSQAAEYLVQFLDCLAVDVEHNGYPIGHENYGLRLVQLGGEAGGVVFDPSDSFSASLIQETVERARMLNAHNAGADLIPLEAAGLCEREAWGRMSDTVISAKLTDPNLTDSDESGLKPLSKNMLGDYGVAWKADVKRRELFKAGGWATETEVTTPKDKSGWAMVPVCVEFVRYAASDVMDCAAIHRMLKPGLDAMYGGSE